MLAKAPDRLRADFQRFYGLDLDMVGHGIRCRRAADLATRLPREACVWQAFDKRMEWTVTDWLLASIADNTNFIAWTKTKDASRRGAKWKGRVARPGEARGHAAHGTTAVAPDELAELLSRPRGMTERTLDHGN